MIDLNLVLKLHLKWLRNECGGKRADLQGADLQGANLRWADLQRANLQGADLRWADLQRANLLGANLQRADLQGADLRWADLRWADLQGANLDFSCFPLWCGSFKITIDDNLLEQFFTHIKMLNISKCSTKNKKLVKSIPNYVKKGLKNRHNLNI